ncbi:MAG: alpha/beta fold hydrolase [Firmicutes bacterium]|jgi:alpha/beta superfamily hydrolase|nr:alpha/beta fold hydrolase [Bacillota bacterium]
MKQEKVFFPSGTLNLEGRLALLPRPGAGAGVVLCHPHPLYGGSMDNNVVYAISKALAEKGIASFCFNFRGVGRSEGVHDGGQGEIDDTLAAIDCLAGHSEIDSGRVGLAGYSFGGAIALSAGMQSGRIKAVAAVSPQEIPDLDFAAWPRLVLCGADDTLIPASFILQQKEKITGPDGAGAVEVIKGADHFWHGDEKVLAGRIASFFEQHLLTQGS